MKIRQNVTIKGTKDGLTLHLDDLCSFEELKKELHLKLLESVRSQGERQLINVKVQAGNRYLSEIQKEELIDLIRQKENLIVDTIHSNVITKDEAEKMKQEREIVLVSKIIRSGQVLQVPGDLLLIGDVNPGGTVMAGGNIFIMGTLKGIAHAGCYGKEDSVVAASIMKPTQLRIGKSINRSPDHTSEEDKQEMECAYIDENNQIVVDRLQVLTHLRPNLTKLERGH